ncbi:MAG: cyanate hydratase [Halorubrum sp. J07HR59]|nr:MAG: cyanate hydratase [Halorubrum sp. J07HR59]
MRQKRRDRARERLLAAKRDADVTYQDIAETVGQNEVWVAAVIFGEASADEAQARAIVEALDSQAPVETIDDLQLAPRKGDDQPTIPSDPMLYRLYEIPHVYGDAIKEIVHEEFGDGIMSAIDFSCHVDRVTDAEGDRVKITYEGKFLPYKRW